MCLRGGLAALLVAGVATIGVAQNAAPARAATVPAFDHVFVIVMENHSYGSIIGSASAPYINSLRQSGGLATGYYDIGHPSLPNYLALTGGSAYGITSDCTTCWISATNVADNLEAAGKSWKAYQESMPSACFVGDSYPYAQKHDPFIYFNDIRTNASRCQSHVVPYSKLTTDLASTSTTPNYAFITPNMCNDMHDCSVATGDSWLAQQVPLIRSSAAFTTQRSLLAVVWDEGDTSGDLVPLILVGSGVAANTVSSSVYNHYSLLKTIETGLGLQTLTSNDAGAVAIGDFFGLVGWTDLGGIATSRSAAATWGSARLDTFVRGTDNALWHRSWNGSVWSSWESLGGVLMSSPSATTQGANSIDIFARGTDDAVWHRSWNGTGWAAWNSLGGVATSAPAAASSGTGRLDMVVRGTDLALWHRSWNGTAWSAWDTLGGVATSDPGVASSGAGQVHVFVRGTDSAMWHRSGDGSGAWATWGSLGGILTSAPSATSCGAGRVDVFVTGTDTGIWQRGFNGSSWMSWNGLHGSWSTGPAAACTPGGTSVQLFERAPDMAVVYSSATGT